MRIVRTFHQRFRIRLHFVETGVTYVRWRKRFTETGQIIPVTNQLQGRLYYC